MLQWFIGFPDFSEIPAPFNVNSPNLFSYSTDLFKTRLHSNRVQTVHALTVSQSMLCRGGCTWSWGVYLVQGVSAPGRCLFWGVCLLQEGGVAPGESALGGWCTWSQGGVPAQVLPTVDRQMPVNTLPCPKLRLRAVKNEEHFLISNLKWLKMSTCNTY